ncbi:MAG: siderophore-interacting protein [Nocardioides sp.]|uniref:siderophore-interacting protein n=1 Tax=Nocardioides sp. TaxID=35761 RepID=UPI0039E6A78C
MPRSRRENKVFEINIRTLTVSRVEDLSPGFRRITLTGGQLRPFTTSDGIKVGELQSLGFDDHVKLVVPGHGESAAVPPRQVDGLLDWSGASPAKDFTPRRWDPVAGEMDLDFVRHGTGFASSWVERVQAGDLAHIAGPKISALLPTGVDWLLLGGDETALPAMARLLEEWPTGVRGQLFVEVGGPADELPLAVPDGVELTWVHRGAVAAGASTALFDAVTAAPWWPGEAYCWFAGEAISLKPIRNWLKNERQVPPDCYEVTGYWRYSAAPATEDGKPLADPGEEAVDALRQRWEQLTDLTAPSVVWTAVASGVLGHLERQPCSPAVLARELGLDEPTLRALCRYLVSVDVLAADPTDPSVTGAGVLRLGGIGEFVVSEDDEYDDPALALWALTPDRLLTTLRTGAPAPSATGEQMVQVLAADSPLGQAARDFVTFDAAWPASSVLSHHAWDEHSSVTVRGLGADALATALRDTHPGLPVTVGEADASDADARAATAAMQWLETLDDPAVEAAMRRMREQLERSGATLVLVERVLEDDGVHDHDAELDLQLRAAFGGGLRSAAQIEQLLDDAGFSLISTPGGRDLGWERRLWVARA